MLGIVLTFDTANTTIDANMFGGSPKTTQINELKDTILETLDLSNHNSNIPFQLVNTRFSSYSN